ncbi:MAG: VCBS repeat-containing protein [Planctomycetota bacterium]
MFRNLKMPLFTFEDMTAAALALAAAAPATAQPWMDQFGSANIAVMREHTSCAGGDFDGDGTDEFVITSIDGSQRLAMLLYKSGGFALATRRIGDVRLAVGTAPSAIAAGDFDGDGSDEVAVAIAESSTRLVLRIYSYRGGAFTRDATQVIVTSGAEHALTTGDFNRDGRDDVVLTTIDGSGRLSVLVHRLAGATLVRFGDVRIVVGDPTHALSAADYNGDGRDDVSFTCIDGSGRVALMLYDFGSGTPMRFGDVRIAVAGTSQALCSGDFDFDGKADVALANIDGSQRIALLVYEFTAGSMQRSGDWRLSSQAKHAALTAGDYDQDGRDEIAILRDSDLEVFRLGQSSATDRSYVYWSGGLPSGPDAYDLGSGDFDGDGRADLGFVKVEGASQQLVLCERDAGATVASGCRGTIGLVPVLREESGSAGREVRLGRVTPGSSAWVFYWTSRWTPPLDLSGYGMPGCGLSVPLTVTQGMAPSGAELAATLGLPNRSVRLFVQALIFDSRANPAGLVTSNTIDLNHPHVIE